MPGDQPFKLPDTVIGIGGTGKEVVFQMLDPEEEQENEWILRKVMESPTEEQLETYIVETAQGDVGNEKHRCNQINTKIENIAEDYDDYVDTPEINYINVVNSAETGGHELINKEIINGFAENTSLQCWWFGDSKIDTRENYSNGVVRRRALGKGLYYAARGGPDPIHSMVRGADAGTSVDIVVGLGGGTGSGMCLDIARALQKSSNVNITLFGVIPGTGQDNDVRANAFAALSELEYLSLTEQNPFQNVVLIPFEPVEDKSEFDEAIVNSIIAYNNMRSTNIPRKFNEEHGQGPNKYAPFTIAVPQVFQYDAPGIQQTRENFEDYLKERASIREIEQNLYNDLEKYLDDYAEETYNIYDGNRYPDGYQLKEDGIEDLHERIRDIESLLSLDNLERCGYEAVSSLDKTLQDTKDEILDGPSFSSDEVEKRKRLVVDELPEMFVENDLGKPAGGFNRTEDEELYELLEKEFSLIEPRRELRKAINFLEPGLERDALNEILKTDSSGTLQKTDISDQIGEYQSDINDLRTFREDYQQAKGIARSELTDKLEEWKSKHRSTIETLLNLQEHIKRIEELLDKLESALKSVEMTANKADPESDINLNAVELGFSQDQFRELNEKLEAVGLDQISVSSFKTSARKLCDARQVWNNAQPTGVIEKTKQLASSSDPMNQYKRYTKQIKSDVYTVPDWGPKSKEFDATTEAVPVKKRKQELSSEEKSQSRRRKTLVNELIRSLHDMLHPPDLNLYDIADKAEDLNDRSNITGLEGLGTDAYEFRNKLDQDIETADSGNTDEVMNKLCNSGNDSGPIYRMFESAYLGPFDDAINDVTERIDERKDQVGKLEELSKLIDDGIRLRDVHNDRTLPEEIPDVGEVGTGDEESPFVKTKTAQDRGLMLNQKDINEAGLWSEPREQEYIKQHLGDVAELVNKQGDEIPLVSGSISTGHPGSSKANYEQFRVAPVYMSRMFDNMRVLDKSAEIQTVKRKLKNGGVHIASDSQYKPMRVGFGGPWDVSATVFVGGVMLDNLRPFKGAYRDAYQSEQEDLGEDTFIRHTHGLDGIDTGTNDLFNDADGAYIRREELFNINSADDRLYLLDNDEPTIVDKLIDSYEIRQLESKVPIYRSSSSMTTTSESRLETDD